MTRKNVKATATIMANATMALVSASKGGQGLPVR